jgi:hypothetical protein
MSKGNPKRRAKQAGIGDGAPHQRRQFVPAQELAEALADAPKIDYEELRADIDAYVDQDPTPCYWVE